jgi:hypothetical protein
LRPARFTGPAARLGQREEEALTLSGRRFCFSVTGSTSAFGAAHGCF